jgi:polysaccharide biosynthesis protein PslH
MKILYTTPVLLHPPAGGPALRVENSIKALHTVAELHLISRAGNAAIGGNAAEIFYRKHSRYFFFSPSTRPPGILSRVVNKIFYKIFKKKLIKDNRLQKDIDFIIDYARRNAISIVWFGYGNISHAVMKGIKEKAPELKLVCDTDSVWSRYISRELPYEQDPERKIRIEAESKQKEKEEADWVNFCDVTTGVSEVDTGYYQSLTQHPEKVRLFSNVIDLDSYTNIPPPPAGFKKPNIYLAGTFWKNSPMEKAARWILEEVLPVVRESLPGIHFYIIGAGSDKELRDVSDEGVTITGKLETVLPYLCNADISIVPLTFESGTRYKILEAGACGIPIVSTTLGAEGIPVTDGKDILIADEAGKFAECIVGLSRDREWRNRLAENCKELIRKKYSLETLREEAKDIIAYLNAATK